MGTIIDMGGFKDELLARLLRSLAKEPHSKSSLVDK